MRQRRQLPSDARDRAEVEVGRRRAPRRRARPRGRPPTDRRSGCARGSDGRCRASPHWPAATTKQPFSIGPRPQQHLPVVAAGGLGEGRRHEQDPRAARGQRPVELGKAQVVADREADDLTPSTPRSRGRRRRRGRRTRGRPCRRRPRRTGGSCGRRRAPRRRGSNSTLALAKRSGRSRALVDRAGQHVDAELGGEAGEQRVAGPVDGFGGVSAERRVTALERPRLGQHDQAGAGGGGAADERVAAATLAALSDARVHLHAGDPHDAGTPGRPGGPYTFMAPSVLRGSSASIQYERRGGAGEKPGKPTA